MLLTVGNVMGADDGNVLRLYATLKESQLDAEESLVIRKLKDALKLSAAKPRPRSKNKKSEMQLQLASQLFRKPIMNI